MLGLKPTRAPYKLIFVLILGCILFGVSEYVASGWIRPLQPINSPSTVIVLPPKSNAAQLIQQLYQRGWVRFPLLAKLQLKLLGERKLQAGEYQLYAGMTFAELVHQIQIGAVIQHPLVIIEGWRIDQLRKALSNSPWLKHETILMSDADVSKALGLNVMKLEGQFFPDTYAVTRGETDLSVLRRAHRSMQSHLSTVWTGRSADLPFRTPHQLLVAASLIEAEGRSHHDRGLISGVIVTRLDTGMRLQLDACAPYTYSHKGLPPHPIALPSLDSLQLAAHPIRSAYRYFVADGRGGTQFNITLKAHQKAVRLYRNMLKIKPLISQ